MTAWGFNPRTSESIRDPSAEGASHGRWRVIMHSPPKVNGTRFQRFAVGRRPALGLKPQAAMRHAVGVDEVMHLIADH